MWLFNKKKPEQVKDLSYKEVYLDQKIEDAKRSYHHARLMFEMAKTSLEETLKEYFKNASPEEVYSIDKDLSTHDFIMFNEVIFDKITLESGYEKFPWRQTTSIPQEVFDYFYKRKKCE
jgi:hypothetical protein